MLEEEDNDDDWLAIIKQDKSVVGAAFPRPPVMSKFRDCCWWPTLAAAVAGGSWAVTDGMDGLFRRIVRTRGTEVEELEDIVCCSVLLLWFLGNDRTEEDELSPKEELDEFRSKSQTELFMEEPWWKPRDDEEVVELEQGEAATGMFEDWRWRLWWFPLCTDVNIVRQLRWFRLIWERKRWE